MKQLQPSPALARNMRFAGLLYLLIILAGLSAEIVLRAPLIDLRDAGATAAAILSDPVRFRLALAADLLMAVCDAGLAILLFLIFRPVAPGMALAAMVFRLIQTCLIAANLLALQTGWLLLSQDVGLPVVQAQSLALLFFDLHGHGYDLGLVFFGITSLMTGALIWQSGIVAKGVGVGLVAAASVYLIGSCLRFFAPDICAVFTPAYVVPILAETVFCLRLLARRP
ncbi:DUF4386 domain-containing protein [Shimia sp. SDUM112013]|uniref:DUF4386 domain-containing protein n=1 Tax=Shimia sp. SDUM112013 TaxID=3136160 RepID=UPI0032EC44D6